MSDTMSTNRDPDIRLIPTPHAGRRRRVRAVCHGCGWRTRPLLYETAVRKADRHDVQHFAEALAGIAGFELE